MGLFDRLLKKDSQDPNSSIKPRKPAKDKPEEFFLDADSSSSLGDVNYMRESKTIRRTFPGTIESPGTGRCTLAMMSPRIALASWVVRLLAALGRWSLQGAGRPVLARHWTLGARRFRETPLRHPLGPLPTRIWWGSSRRRLPKSSHLRTRPPRVALGSGHRHAAIGDH